MLVGFFRGTSLATHVAVLGLVLLSVPAAGQVSSELPCPDMPSDFRTHTVSANVVWGEPTTLVPVPNLYAWEHARVTVTDAVNVNREIYEERKCNWFGINCWYEKRVRNNPVTADQIPFHYFATAPVKAFDPNGDEGRTEIKKAGETKEFSENYDDYWRGVAVTESRVLRGIIGHRNGGINRTSCQGEPRVCSVGAYTIKFEIDSGPRARRLVDELARQAYTYDALMSPDVLNANLRQSNADVRACLASALYRQAMTFHGTGSNSTPAERQKILQQALNFNPTNPAVKTALGSTYLETGQFDEARAQTTSAIADLEKLVRGGAAKADDYMKLAENYATLAETSWRETAGNSTRAANDAVGSLRLAIERLQTRLQIFPLDPGAVAARSKLVESSVRLAQVLARLGTAQDMSEAIAIIGAARGQLPRRLHNAIPIESDAVGGLIAVARQDGPVFSDRSWKLDISNLAVTDDQALTSFSTDPSGAANPAVFSLGLQPQRISESKEYIRTGRPENLVGGGELCIAQAAILSPRRAIAAIQQSSGNSLLLTGAGINPKFLNIDGRLEAVALSRSTAGDRVATLAWRRSGLLVREGWQLVESDAALTASRDPVLIDGQETDEPMLRAGPGGAFYAVGLRSKTTGRTRWSLLGLDGDKLVSSPITCQGQQSTDLPIDDVALLEGSQNGSSVATVLGISAQCIAHAAPAKAGAPVVLLGRDKDVARAETAIALKDRTTAFAWATKVGDPFAILSWGTDAQGRPALSTYKILVSRWSFTAEEQSPGRRPIYQADVAKWAVSTQREAPVCAGFGSALPNTTARFRITSLSLSTDKGEGGHLLDLPALQVAVAGLYGAVSLAARSTEEEAPSTIAASPPPAPTSAVAPTAFGTAPTLAALRPARPGRLPTTAVCNAGRFLDFQLGRDGRVWSLRRSDLSVVRLLDETRGACEGSFMSVGVGAVSRRHYAAPSHASGNLLQVIDADASGRVLRLSIANPPPGDAKDGDPQVEIVAPLTCTLSAATPQPAICDAAAIREAFGADAASQVLVLKRDISTDPGKENQERLPSEAVERATALVVLEPPSGGKQTAHVARFPVRLPLEKQTFRIPEKATSVALLAENTIPFLLALLPSDKLVAFDESGSSRGEVSLAKNFTNWKKTRRLVARDRIVLVSQGSATTEAQIKTIEVKDGTLRAPNCDQCKLQTDAFADDLAHRLGLGPALNTEGRIERFAADARLRRILVPTAKDATLAWGGWKPIAFGGTPEPKLNSAGAGVPLLLDSASAFLAPQPGTIEIWGIGQ